MSDNQSEFKGWAKVEVMGHQSHVGYVTTEAYGAAVLFRIDRPEIPEQEETLTHAEFIGVHRCQPGSVIKRGKIEAQSVLVGSASIYRIIPCSEEVALKAIRESERRPLMLVRLADAPQLAAAESDDEEEDRDPYGEDDYGEVNADELGAR